MDTDNDRPNLSRTLFWDVDFDKIDWPNRAQFVIERVLERGSFPEWQEIKRYYGVEVIKQAALNARFLDMKTWHFCSAIFNEPLINFRCSKLMPFQRELWPL